jgi:hypothetical protein
MTKKNRRPGYDKSDFNFILFVGYVLVIIGALLAIGFSFFYSDPVSEDMGGLGQMGGPIVNVSNEPCATFAMIMSIMAIALCIIGHKTENNELALFAAIMVIITLVLPSLIIGVIAFIIFLRYGFE